MDKILLVEDDNALIDIYTIIFTKYNFTIEVAENGQECLDKVKDFQPDLILLDIMMPVMNGLQVLEKLKQDPQTNNIPVIMLSNIAETKEETKAIDLGALQYLVKSQYLPNEIVNIVKEALTRQRLHV